MCDYYWLMIDEYYCYILLVGSDYCQTCSTSHMAQSMLGELLTSFRNTSCECWMLRCLLRVQRLAEVLLETSSRCVGSKKPITGLNLLVHAWKIRGVRFHRIREFKQYYFNSVPPTSRCCSAARGYCRHAPHAHLTCPARGALHARRTCSTSHMAHSMLLGLLTSFRNTSCADREDIYARIWYTVIWHEMTCNGTAWIDMLSCAVPCRAVPCRALPCRAVPCRAVPYRAVPCMPCRAAPRRAVPCRAAPRRVALCYVTICVHDIQ